MTAKRYTVVELRDMAKSYDACASDHYFDETISAALRQAAEDCEDAERYRFAKEDTKAFENYFGCEYHEIDAVIDTARTQEKARD